MDMRSLLAITLLLGVLPVASADDWPAPQIREVFSLSRSCFVRVTPGSSWGDTFGFRGAAKGPYATAEFYRRQADRSYRLASSGTLLNPVAPVDFFVTDRGFLVTLDNWHNRGYGKVAAFYSPEGKPIRSYELDELFTKEEIARLDHSVSSIAWHKGAAYVREDQETLYLMVNDAGAYFVFETATGAYQYCENRRGRWVCRDSNTHRTWKPYHEPSLKR